MNSKPPLECLSCGSKYFVSDDYTRCGCGQDLWRVEMVDGHPVGPPSMPEHLKQAMAREWRQRMAQRTQYWHSNQAPVPFTPRDMRHDARNEFGRESDDRSRAEFYAMWAAYDHAVLGMPAPQQALQRSAEILELERWFSS